MFQFRKVQLIRPVSLSSHPFASFQFRKVQLILQMAERACQERPSFQFRKVQLIHMNHLVQIFLHLVSIPQGPINTHP